MTSMKSSFASAMTSCNVKCTPTSRIQKSIQTRGPMVRAPWYSKCGDHCFEPQRNPLCSSGAIYWLRAKIFADISCKAQNAMLMISAPVSLMQAKFSDGSRHGARTMGPSVLWMCCRSRRRAPRRAGYRPSTEKVRSVFQGPWVPDFRRGRGGLKRTF